VPGAGMARRTAAVVTVIDVHRRKADSREKGGGGEEDAKCCLGTTLHNDGHCRRGLGASSRPAGSYSSNQGTAFRRRIGRFGSTAPL